MRRLLALLLFLPASLEAQQSYTNAGEAKTVCSIWDGVDRALVDGSGNLLVGDGTGAFNVIVDSGTLTATVTDGSGALNVIVDSSALPSGAATSALQSTGNTSLGTIAGAVAGTEMQVDVLTSALPSGAATSALQSTGNTSLGTIAGAVSGTEMQVDVLTMPSVTIGTFPDNEPVNVAQMNGVAVTMGNGASGTGVQRVTIASDSTGQVAIASLPNEGQQTAANSISVTPDTDNDFVAPDASAPPTGRAVVGGLTSGATGGLTESLTVCDQFVNVNVSSATTTLLITGVSGRHARICSMSLLTAGANNVALISGTGATCGTGTTGMTGGTTAATGYNFAANGGLTQGTGSGEINRTNATGDSVCVITSAATQLSGRISYAIY